MRIEITAETADEGVGLPEPKVYNVQGSFVFASRGGNYMHGDIAEVIAEAEKASAILRSKLAAGETVAALMRQQQAIAEQMQAQAIAQDIQRNGKPLRIQRG
jgi:hypothetical protein